MICYIKNRYLYTKFRFLTWSIIHKKFLVRSARGTPMVPHSSCRFMFDRLKKCL